MEAFVKLMDGIVVGIGSIFIGVLLLPLFGAVGGWIVGLFFGETILGIVGQMGLKNVSMWQLGAFLGFVSGFLKTKVSVEAKSGK